MNTNKFIREDESNLTRRDFLRVTALSAVGVMAGCAVNPVTGKSQLMLVSEETEIQIDKTNSPHQFSADYGILQDRALNGYIQDLGKKLAAGTHRPSMPYQCQGVNATYVNAYAFPGGSIAATRGILLSLDNEAELAALLGHELGHVNARHTAEQMSKTMIAQSVVGGIGMYASSKGYGEIASQLGMLGAGALLASYSRDNEREADALGMEYMVKAGYGSEGFIGLMDMLKGLSKGGKHGTVDVLFSTHPMSDERYNTAVARANETYASAKNRPLQRDRYMDHTAKLRAIKAAIASMQLGQEAMGGKKYDVAEDHYKSALKQAPEDYAGLLMIATCYLEQKKDASALPYIEKAKAVYPQEALADHLGGMANIRTKQFDAALADFTASEKKLPGNPNTIFYKGYAWEGMTRREESAAAYQRYLQVVTEGPQAQHAYRRLVEWGVVQQNSQTSN